MKTCSWNDRLVQLPSSFESSFLFSLFLSLLSSDMWEWKRDFLWNHFGGGTPSPLWTGAWLLKSNKRFFKTDILTCSNKVILFIFCSDHPSLFVVSFFTWNYNRKYIIYKTYEIKTYRIAFSQIDSDLSKSQTKSRQFLHLLCNCTMGRPVGHILLAQTARSANFIISFLKLHTMHLW